MFRCVRSVTCGDDGCETNHQSCAPIAISKLDPFLSSLDCLKFTRSLRVPNLECSFGKTRLNCGKQVDVDMWVAKLGPAFEKNKLNCLVIKKTISDQTVVSIKCILFRQANDAIGGSAVNYNYI